MKCNSRSVFSPRRFSAVWLFLFGECAGCITPHRDLQEENKPMLGVVDALALLFCSRLVARVREQRKIIGEAIRNYRKLAGISQEKLAEKSDLHPVYVGKVERGEQWVSLHALLRIAEALGVRLRDLVADV
jgi:DNA-binding XRE family transcriptional regulator